ncbi:RHS repeat-associated core domain-containing protein [Pseudomonas sp. NPDC089392]|uniref:RHS repeat-associated core domain-containing protein n=1 Tax=Pseudomonas sp. NPDC089392 TaxID=3364459 RepID=UPI0037F15491
MTCYTSYGYFKFDSPQVAAVSFNGEPLDKCVGAYHLGNGARAYSPVLMRFLRPDPYVPFAQGGVNAYGYCAGDPVNHVDPSGYIWRYFRKLFSAFQRVPVLEGGVRILKNHNQGKLAKELKILKARKGEDPRRLVYDASDIVSDDWRPKKFVLGAANELVIALAGRKGSADYVSHPLLAELLNDKRVVSAGTFSVGAEGKIYIHNVSGHYRPKLSDLNPMVEKVRGMGLKPIAVRVY